ncbi:hypothetical protein ACFCY8_10420 [Streptomyces noursei]
MPPDTVVWQHQQTAASLDALSDEGFKEVHIVVSQQPAPATQTEEKHRG